MTSRYASAYRLYGCLSGSEQGAGRRLAPTIIRSEPQGEFPDVKYRFFLSLASTAIMRRALTSARPVRFSRRCQWDCRC